MNSTSVCLNITAVQSFVIIDKQMGQMSTGLFKKKTDGNAYPGFYFLSPLMPFIDFIYHFIIAVKNKELMNL